MPICTSLPGHETANLMFADVRAGRVSHDEVDTWVREMEREGFLTLAMPISQALRVLSPVHMDRRHTAQPNENGTGRACMRLHRSYR